MKNKAKFIKYIYDRYTRNRIGGIYEYRDKNYAIYYDEFDYIKRGSLMVKHKEQQSRIDRELDTVEYIPTLEERKEITKNINNMLQSVWEMMDGDDN